MKKLFSFATALIIMAGIASAAFAQTDFEIVVQLGNGANIGLFSDSDCTVPMTDLVLELDNGGVTFPFTGAIPADNDGYYDPHAIAKTYVKISGSGSGWAVATYTTNSADAQGLVNTVDSSESIPLKYAASSLTTCPDIGDTLTHSDFVSYKWFVNFTGTPDTSDSYLQFITADQVSASNNVVDITLVMGLTISRTTPGAYSTNVAFEVVGN